MFPYATTKSIMKKALEKEELEYLVGQFSVDEVNKIVTNVTRKLATEACIFAEHSEHKTLRREDVIIAAKVMGLTAMLKKAEGDE